MNKILIVLSLFFAACSGNVAEKEASHNEMDEGHKTAVVKSSHALQLNNGAKWKTDEATRKNVAAMVTLVNDKINTDQKNKEKFRMQFQSRIDSLVQQCKMQGADHDALHLWLELVIDDLKEIKETDDDYQKSYTVLKKDVESFYVYFE